MADENNEITAEELQVILNETFENGKYDIRKIF